MFENFFNDLTNTDLFALLTKLTDGLTAGAEGFGIPPMVFYIIGLVAALGIGVFGYKLIKLLTAAVAAVVGYYFVGAELFFLVEGWLNLDLPQWVPYIPAAIFGALFFLLAFKKFSYAFYTVMALVGFVLGYFYTKSITLAIGGAILLALLCMFILRVSFILLTSVSAAFVSVAMVSALVPSLELLKLSYTNWIGLAIVGGVALVLIALQLIITRKSSSVVAAPSFVKLKKSNKVLRQRVIRDL